MATIDAVERDIATEAYSIDAQEAVHPEAGTQYFREVKAACVLTGNQLEMAANAYQQFCEEGVTSFAHGFDCEIINRLDLQAKYLEDIDRVNQLNIAIDSGNPLPFAQFVNHRNAWVKQQAIEAIADAVLKFNDYPQAKAA